MTTLQNVIEIGFGLLFLIGAVFNLLYTMRHSDEFYGSFADNAWLPFSGRMMHAIVLPRARPVTGLIITTQLAAALMILSRGPLTVVGLLTGAAFAASAAVVSSPGGAIANFAMAALLAILAVTRWLPS